jgi:hypothetical protein
MAKYLLNEYNKDKYKPLLIVACLFAIIYIFCLLAGTSVLGMILVKLLFFR